MPPWPQAKVFGVLSVAKAQGVKITDDAVAAMVYKIGPHGKESREHPSHTAIAKLRGHFGEDPNWYPGKVTENAKKRGPKPYFSQQKKLCVAAAAMALKKEDHEPTVAQVILRAPKATTNPRTGQAFTPKYILNVFRTLCYDKDPSDPWDHQLPYQKNSPPQRLDC